MPRGLVIRHIGLTYEQGMIGLVRHPVGGIWWGPPPLAWVQLAAAARGGPDRNPVGWARPCARLSSPA